MASNKDGAVKKKDKIALPSAALRRFANDLENDAQSNKFLQINKDRVNEFVRKYKDDKKDDITNGDVTSGKRSAIAHGIYDYPEAKFHSTLQLQNTPEFSSALGFRSRFGDGDGSFFDRWLMSGVIESKRVVDEKGMPIEK